jgi:hypothetical protein
MFIDFFAMGSYLTACRLIGYLNLQTQEQRHLNTGSCMFLMQGIEIQYKNIDSTGYMPGYLCGLVASIPLMYLFQVGESIRPGRLEQLSGLRKSWNCERRVLNKHDPGGILDS